VPKYEGVWERNEGHIKKRRQGSRLVRRKRVAIVRGTFPLGNAVKTYRS